MAVVVVVDSCNSKSNSTSNDMHACMRVCGCVHVYEQYLKCSGHTLKLLDSSMISFYTFVQTYVKLQLSLAILVQRRFATAVERLLLDTAHTCPCKGS